MVTILAGSYLVQAKPLRYVTYFAGSENLCIFALSNPNTKPLNPKAHISALLLLLALAACQPKPLPNINLEVAHNAAAHHIISPGMGWLGLISEKEIYMYYFSHNYSWEVDNVNPFVIPEKNIGVLGMGFGSIGVVKRNRMDIYLQDQDGKWVKDDRYGFDLPRGYDRIFTVKQEWELAIIGLEFNGRLEFYYFDRESGKWLRDETATFMLPPGIEDYFSMGNMTVAVLGDNKLGLYYLHPNADWVFAENYVLSLPENRLGVIPFEPGIIAVLEPFGEEKRMQFYQLDVNSSMWIIDETMNFYLP